MNQLKPLDTFRVPPFLPTTHCQAAINLGLRCFVIRETVDSLQVVRATPKRHGVFRDIPRPEPVVASHQDLATAYELAWEQYKHAYRRAGGRAL